MQITKKDILTISIIYTILVFTTFLAQQWLGNIAFFIAIILSNIFILFILFEMYRRVNQKSDIQIAYNREEQRAYKKQREQEQKLNANHYKQIEALFSIFSSINPSLPLPETRGWAASPDFLKKIIEIIQQEKPISVMEASSGVSTLIIAYCLKKIGRGKVISLEHDLKYAKSTKHLLAMHGLEKWAEVVHAPLKKIDINNEEWLWYDIKDLTIDSRIDLLVIDGPPASTQDLARYPALPLLWGDIKNGATIILDDGIREDEKKIVEQWKDELKYLDYDYFDFEKGAFLIKKHDTEK